MLQITPWERAALQLLAEGTATSALAVVVSGIGVAAFHPEGAKFAGLASRGRQGRGMSIFSVGGTAVSTPEEVTAAIAAAREQGLGAALLRVQSGQGTGFVALSFNQG